MTFLELFSTSFQYYPKSTLLFLVATANLWWVFYIVFWKKNFRKKIYKVYFFHAFFLLLWIISNAYFQSKFLVFGGEVWAKFMGLFANIVSCFAIVAFYYLSCLLKSTTGKVGRWVWALIIFMIIEILFFNLVPGLTVVAAKIFPDESFQLVFGKWNNVFFLIGVIVLIMGITNFIIAIKTKRGKIENKKFSYIFFGTNLMYVSVIFCHAILPAFFKNFTLVWLPGVLSIADILIFGYAILVQRFFNIPYRISYLLKRIISVSVAILTTFIVYKLFPFLQSLEIYYLYILAIFSILFQYSFFLHFFFESYTFYRLFGITNVEYFRQIIQELKTKNIVYTDIQNFEKTLQEVFCTKLGIESTHILLIDNAIKHTYPKLIQHCKTNPEILVTKELQFKHTQENIYYAFFSELEQLGEIVLPIYNSSFQELIGFFVLGNKPFNDVYSKEEIESIEKMSSFLNLCLTSILYQSILQEEVDKKTEILNKKTKQLQVQNKQMHETIKQQKDFIMVTAHELRTPVTVMVAGLELMKDYNLSSEEMKEYTNGSYKGAIRLKNLVQKLFEVQQLDLGKMNLQYTTINIAEFIKGIRKDGESLIQKQATAFVNSKKDVDFSVAIDLPKNTSVQADKVRLQQILHNLLMNAVNFVPENKGKILLSVEEIGKNILFSVIDNGVGVPDETKKTIFNRFRTNHADKSMGIGLGLYICKKLVELHKGKIWVEDTKGGGATFYVSLPKKKKE